MNVHIINKQYAFRLIFNWKMRFLYGNPYQKDYYNSIPTVNNMIHTHTHKKESLFNEVQSDIIIIIRFSQCHSHYLHKEYSNSYIYILYQWFIVNIGKMTKRQPMISNCFPLQCECDQTAAYTLFNMSVDFNWSLYFFIRFI